MILKTSKPLPKKYLFNAAGAAFLFVTAVLVVRESFVEENVPPCTERFQTAMLFTWQQPSGTPISVAELQAKLGGRDWGISDNAAFVQPAGAPVPTVLQIRLSKGPRSEDGKAAKGGMGFTWMPRQLANVQSACLSYSVWFPEDFSFAPGGALPGLFGGEPDGATKLKAATAFSTRYGWRDDGLAEIRAIAPDSGAATVAVGPEGWRIPRGRWVKLEQEVVLNSRGEEDGVLRVWVDGELRVQRKDVQYRADERARFLGVIADLHYGISEPAGSVGSKDTVVRLSPFELRWE